VAGASVRRINGSQNVVEQRPFLEIGIMGIRLQREQPAREFQHVVNIAGFSRSAIDPISQLVWLAEIFVLAMAASGISVMLHHPIPEETGGHEIAGVSGVGKSRCRADHLWNYGIAMTSREIILMTLQRFSENAVFE